MLMGYPAIVRASRCSLLSCRILRRLTWGSPFTRKISSDLFRNLYLFKGVLYAVNEDDSDFPAVASLLSANPDDTTGKREPAGEDKYRVVTIKQAQEIFGNRISVRLGGTTVCGAGAVSIGIVIDFGQFSIRQHVQILFNDQGSGPPRHMSSFLDHYFHRE